MMKHSFLESSIQDTSNGGRLMALASIDSELLTKVFKHKNANNSASIDARAMKRPPFDASRNGDSDDMCFIFLRLIDTEYD